MTTTLTRTTAARPRWALRFAAAVAIAASTLAATAWQLGSGTAVALNSVLFAAVVAVYLTVGVLIMERRPGNRVGPIILIMPGLIGSYVVVTAYLDWAGDADGAVMAAWLVSLMDAPLFILVSLLFLLFPDGRLPSPRWRLLLLADLVLAVIVVAWTAFKPGTLAYYPRFENPFGGDEGALDVAGPIAYMLLVGSVGLSALSLVGRWRRGGPLERAQLKWVAAAASFAAIAMASYGIFIGPGTFNDSFDLLVGLALGFFPVAIGIAILRYHLFEIDRLVSRSIAYVLITGVLVATYAAAILLLQGPLGAITGGDTISVALSTLIVAALFQPLRGRVQATVDRRFDRARFDAERTTAAFSDRLRDQTDIETVLTDLDGTVRSALKPTALGTWLRRTTE